MTNSKCPVVRFWQDDRLVCISWRWKSSARCMSGAKDPSSLRSSGPTRIASMTDFRNVKGRYRRVQGLDQINARVPTTSIIWYVSRYWCAASHPKYKYTMVANLRRVSTGRSCHSNHPHQAFWNCSMASSVSRACRSRSSSSYGNVILCRQRYIPYSRMESGAK